MTDEPYIIEDALPIEPARAAQILLYVIAGLFVLTFVWAATARLDRVTRGHGRVVPSNQLQEIQYLEGGIVKEILVSAGDKVKAGEVLVRLDPTQMNAAYAQGRDSYDLLAARILRLEAEAQGEAPIFDDEIKARAPRIVADELSLYKARRAEFESARAVQTAGLEDAEASLQYAEQSFSLANEELKIVAPLAEKGIEPQIELVRARQREATAQGDVQRARIAVDRAKSELLKVEQNYQAAAADELTKAKAQMAAFSGDLPALRDKMERTEVRSPIDGVVNRVLVSTLGGVVQPGETIVEIVPSEDTLLVEAQVKPADIGFLRIGQKARVKLTAYDSAIYGSLDGHIEQISADAIADAEKKERYYLIKVRTDRKSLHTKEGELAILPGMAAEVDVLNGKRTVLAYLLTPISRLQGEALRDQ